MKKILLSILVLCSLSGYAQNCWIGFGSSNDYDKIIKPAVIIDWSLRYYQPSNFNGIGVHAGAWFGDRLGITVGYVEYKLNQTTIAERTAAITLHAKKTFMNDRLVINAFFANGLHNYQDIGLRVAYDIFNNGVPVGLIFSRTMHVGITFPLAINIGSK